MLEARIRTFETVAMYTMTVLLALPTPGAVQHHQLRLHREQRQEPLGPPAPSRPGAAPGQVFVQ